MANFAMPRTHRVPKHGLVDARLVKSIYLVVTGLILHDVPERFAMANAYIASPSLGLLVACADGAAIQTERLVGGRPWPEYHRA